MAREASNFEQGTNWKAKNAASIKLRSGDGKKHPVRTVQDEPKLSQSESDQANARRAKERERLEKASQAKAARQRGAQREKKMDARHAEKDHTPHGWVPANQRAYVDPFSRAEDPRRSGPLPKKKRRGTPKELQ